MLVTRTLMWIRRIRPRSVVQLLVQVLGLLVALAVGLAMGSRLIIVSGASMEPLSLIHI